ncbi:hypothetical protein [Mucilaginibacter phyllosphaerae]|uniref:Lipoprotein n=1 Tax=Mucilaginibacter phyllosphaerae TaxID=1812349 RepID=A0ABR6I495_9SPHI|nr:hypothetical protein [Mucilaginibacter phyllosphaerae]MBB3967855.1 hypothetical protein [Mucilaginibacter phyllosphaerae]
MKKEIVKMMALLLFGAAVLTGCSIENRGHRGRYYNDRYRHDHRYDNHDHDGRY